MGVLREQQGLKTLLQEKGSNFSGGQCQRLALARGLLHDSPIYIFDEATSNIDAESEEMIMEVIHEMAKEKTVLLISHRLSNVIDSDYVYFLKDGKIEESGTHDELLLRKQAYARLYESQHELESYAAASSDPNKKYNGNVNEIGENVKSENDFEIERINSEIKENTSSEPEKKENTEEVRQLLWEN